MKKILFVVCIYFICNFLFSQNIKFGVSYNYPSEYGSIIINKDSYSMKSLGGKEGVITESYKSKIAKKSYYTWLEKSEDADKKYIILTCSVRDLDFLTLVCSREASNNYFKNWEINYNYSDDYNKYDSIPRRIFLCLKIFTLFLILIFSSIL